MVEPTEGPDGEETSGITEPKALISQKKKLRFQVVPSKSV